MPWKQTLNLQIVFSLVHYWIHSCCWQGRFCGKKPVWNAIITLADGTGNGSSLMAGGIWSGSWWQWFWRRSIARFPWKRSLWFMMVLWPADRRTTDEKCWLSLALLLVSAVRLPARVTRHHGGHQTPDSPHLMYGPRSRLDNVAMVTTVLDRSGYNLL